MNAMLLRAMAPLGLASLLANVGPSCGQNWTQTSAPIASWSCVASSADGSLLAAGSSDGFIYTSTNSGVTWLRTSAPSNSWTSLASSADGTTLFAATSLAGPPWDTPSIYVSRDAGVTWESAGQSPVDFVTCSADGTKVAAAGWDSVFVSTNSGASWTLLGPPSYPTGQTIPLVVSTADGNTLVVVLSIHWTAPSQIVITASSVWTLSTAHYVPPPHPNAVLYTAVATSADGKRLAATINNFGYTVYPPTTNFCGATQGMLYASSDSGQSGVTTCTPLTNWTSIASSADGARLIAGAADGAIYTSADAGTNWQPASVVPANWSGVAASADGCKLVAVANGGGIYTWQTTPMPALKITPTGDTLVISWVIPSKHFVLEQNSGLNSTNWTDVATPVSLNLTNLQDQVNLGRPTDTAFYRLNLDFSPYSGPRAAQVAVQQ